MFWFSHNYFKTSCDIHSRVRYCVYYQGLVKVKVSRRRPRCSDCKTCCPMATSKVEDVFDESVSDIGVGSKELEKLKTNLQKVRKVILHRSISSDLSLLACSYLTVV